MTNSILIRQLFLPLFAYTTISCLVLGAHIQLTTPLNILGKPSATSVRSTQPANQKKQVTLWLKNGNYVRGEIVSASDGLIVIDWEGGRVTFAKKEIESIQWSNPPQDRPSRQQS